jgi:hemolysin III
MRDGGWWIIPVLMWIAAIYGIITRIRARSKTIAILPFILLGWLPVIGINRMIEVGSVGGMALIVAGGLAYTGGAWFLANDHRKPYFHATWHMATITGSACHYFFVLEYIARTPLA